MTRATFSALIHGEAGVGKSALGASAPAPRLILDAEGRAKYLPCGPIVFWDPLAGPPPVADGTWNTCIVAVHSIAVMQQAFVWLRSGQHPFMSVILDSLMEIQKRFIDEIAGLKQMTQPDWGALLRRTEHLVRDYRDLNLVESTGIRIVIMTVGTEKRADNKFHPLLQGAMRSEVPYYPDLVGYMFVQPAEDGTPVRRLLVQPHPEFIAKDDTWTFTEGIIDSPNISEMYARLEARVAAEQGTITQPI